MLFILTKNNVVCAGGYERDEVVRKIEWCSNPSMLSARYQATATVMADGRVLVIGGRGFGASFLNSAEIFDPVLGSWVDAGEMKNARTRHAAILLPDGRVLVAGGINSDGVIASAELYDPKNNQWSSAGNLSVARREASAFHTSDGYVYIVGGSSPNPLANVDVFNVKTEKWSVGPALLFPQSKANFVNFENIFFNIGGYELSTDSRLIDSYRVQMFSMLDKKWKEGPRLKPSRRYSTSNVFGKSIVLIGGLSGEEIVADIVSIDINSQSWKPAGTLTIPTWDHRSTVVSGQGVLVVGGVSEGFVPTSRVEFVRPGRKSILLQPLKSPRYGAFLARLNDGRVLVGGGASTYGAFGDTWLSSTEVTCTKIP